PITTASMLYVCTGYIGFVILFSTDFTQVLQTQPGAWNAVGYIVFLGIFCTALAMIVFIYLLKRTSVVFASTVTYLMPIVSLFWGFIFGETITAIHLLGLGIILTGIYLTGK